jgi:hypothetical protein
MYGLPAPTHSRREIQRCSIFQMLPDEPRGRWTRTGNLTRELGLDRGERCNELGQVMYI